MLGFAVSLASLFVAIGYVVMKLLYCSNSASASRPLLPASSFSLRAAFLYRHFRRVYRLHPHQVLKRPHVVELERINFEPPAPAKHPYESRHPLRRARHAFARGDRSSGRKPMVPVGNRPILWHIMKFYAHYGFKEFILCSATRASDQGLLPQLPVVQAMTSPCSSARRPKSLIHSQHDEEDWQVTLIDTGQTTMTGGRIRRALAHVPDDEFLLTYVTASATSTSTR